MTADGAVDCLGSPSCGVEDPTVLMDALFDGSAADIPADRRGNTSGVGRELLLSRTGGAEGWVAFCADAYAVDGLLGKIYEDVGFFCGPGVTEAGVEMAVWLADGIFCRLVSLTGRDDDMGAGWVTGRVSLLASGEEVVGVGTGNLADSNE